MKVSSNGSLKHPFSYPSSTLWWTTFLPSINVIFLRVFSFASIQFSLPVWFSSVLWFFLIWWEYLTYLFLISVIGSLFMSILSKTCSFDCFCFHEINLFFCISYSSVSAPNTKLYGNKEQPSNLLIHHKKTEISVNIKNQPHCFRKMSARLFVCVSVY